MTTTAECGTDRLSDADRADGLPVPRQGLLALGLTPEEIDEALASRPLIMAFHADRADGAWFDVGEARRAIKAIEALRHTKGRWGGSPLKLGPWQVVWVIAPVFGWLVHDDEAGRVVRVIREAWVEVPRKNGKSTLSSGISVKLLLADREPGAEVYAAAGSLEQARRVFDDAKRMALTAKGVRGRVEPLKDVMRVPSTGGVFRALSKIAETAHGLNVSGAVIDEVHVHKRRDLVDAILTGTGARDQPLVVFITTADEGVEGTIYDERHMYVRRCAEGVVDDPGHYGVIWAAEEGDDPFAESTWRKANPGLGVSPSLKYMRREAEKARSTPSYFPTFCRLSLNRRMTAATKWIPMPLWDECAGEVVRAPLRRRRAWGGLDLSAVSDLSAWVLAVESRRPGVDLELLARFWVPEDRLDDLEHQLQVPLTAWAEQGLLEVTEGDAIDYDVIERQVVSDARYFDIQRIGYDRMFAGQLVQRVEVATRGGVELAPIPQTYLGMGPGCKELERLLRMRAIRHGGHQVLRWNASDVEVFRDGNDNMRPRKPDRGRSSSRIDGVVAAVMAMDGYLRRPRRYRAASA